jgi:hypothetical protein
MAKSGWWKPLALLAVVPAVSFAQVAPAPGAAPPSAVVYAVLFYSPTCPHCHQVMTVDLPPLLQRYGSQLRIAGVNTATARGQALYQATVAHFALPEDRLGVPTLVVGTRVLVGSREIPGEITVRQTHEFLGSRPRLQMDDHGRISVMGGVRRETSEDLPAPPKELESPQPPKP